jgi:hypothetical protein
MMRATLRAAQQAQHSVRDGVVGTAPDVAEDVRIAITVYTLSDVTGELYCMG